jgi:formate/nitrite transporter FocA (FNT family)
VLGFVGAALEPHFGKNVAHLGASIGFGLGFVFIVAGRSELFTENFLVPLAGLKHNDRTSWLKLGELWTLSPIFNVLAGMLFVLLLTTHGVMPGHSSNSIVVAANHFDDNDFVTAFVSAVVAGALITFMTWMIEGQETMGVRIALAWVCGAILALGSFNHVIVATIETFFGMRFGAQIGWGDFFQNFFTAAGGNMIGGILFVTLNRFTQARSGAAARGS